MIKHYQMQDFSPVNVKNPRIGIAGDIVLGSEAEKAFNNTKKPSWGIYSNWVRSLDLFIATFDSTFFGNDQKEWFPHVICGNNALNSIPLGKKTIFNLANNHIFDGGREGFLAARKAFMKKGIETVGAGLTLEEAEAPWQGQIANVPINLFSAVHYGCHPRSPLKDGGTVASLESISWWESVTRAVKSKKSLVLVLIHGGIQGSHYPSPKAIEISEKLSNIGVQVVVWSHSHVIQGIKATPKGFIAYGLGNSMHLPLRHDVNLPHENPEYDMGMFLELEPCVKKIDRVNLYFSIREKLKLFEHKLSAQKWIWFQDLSIKINRKNYNLWWIAYRWRQDIFEQSIKYFRRRSFLIQVKKIRWKTILTLLRRIFNARSDAEDV